MKDRFPGFVVALIASKNQKFAVREKDKLLKSALLAYLKIKKNIAKATNTAQDI